MLHWIIRSYSKKYDNAISVKCSRDERCTLLSLGLLPLFVFFFVTVIPTSPMHQLFLHLLLFLFFQVVTNILSRKRN